MKKKKSVMAQAKKKGNFLWRYKTSHSFFISDLNSYNFQSELELKSHFGEQIYVKKLLEAVYGNSIILSSKQLNIWNVILENECRLDVILFRSQLFQSLGSADQAIKNGNICVNGRMCLNPYEVLNIGSVIGFHPKFFIKYIKNKNLEEFVNNTLSVSNHLQTDYKTGTIIFLALPEEGEFPFLISSN